MTAQAILRRETAHFSYNDRITLSRMEADAADFFARYPGAPARAVADKLFSLYSTPHWVGMLVALAYAPSTEIAAHAAAA